MDEVGRPVSKEDVGQQGAPEKKKLYSMRLKEGGSVQDHIKTMTETFNALTVIGDKITEEDRVVHLLASLPDSYCVLVTALEACAEVPKMKKR